MFERLESFRLLFKNLSFRIFWSLLGYVGSLKFFDEKIFFGLLLSLANEFEGNISDSKLLKGLA